MRLSVKYLMHPVMFSQLFGSKVMELTAVCRIQIWDAFIQQDCQHNCIIVRDDSSHFRVDT